MANAVEVVAKKASKKGKGWVAQKYFRTINGTKWNFAQPFKAEMVGKH
jgi:hypothetical protein